EQAAVVCVISKVRVAAIDQGNDPAAATVGNLEKQGTVALLRLLGADGDKVGGKLDLSVLQIDGIGKVYDAPVVRVCYGNREIDSSGDPLVGSRIPEGLAPLHIIAR